MRLPAEFAAVMRGDMPPYPLSTPPPLPVVKHPRIRRPKEPTYDQIAEVDAKIRKERYEAEGVYLSKRSLEWIALSETTGSIFWREATDGDSG